MKMGQAMKMAIKNILSSKLRSILTMLGIIIGISAVIALVSLGQGASKSVSNEISGLGSTMVSVSIPGNSNGEEVISQDEIMAFENYSEVEVIAPNISGSGTLGSGTQKMEGVQIIGSTPSYQKVHDTKIQNGRFILPIDEDNRNKIILLGSNVAVELFGFSNPVGETVKVDGTSFKVAGVLEAEGEELTGSIDDQVIIPFSTAQRFLGQTTITSASVKMASENDMELGMARMENFLYNRFDGDDTKYNVRNQSNIAEALSSVTNTMTMLLAGIASISLIVGGIGIMNIMLVSVTERTREIGIRKAIGANKKDILVQFLIEAVVLSITGGILGIVLGVVSAQILSSLLSMEIFISWWTVVVAVGFSFAIGVGFGLFPANKAANLSPLDALRY